MPLRPRFSLFFFFEGLGFRGFALRVFALGVSVLGFCVSRFCVYRAFRLLFLKGVSAILRLDRGYNPEPAYDRWPFGALGFSVTP